MKPKILVVGDVMLDRYIHGVVERISPEAPIPILRRTSIEHRAGGAANVAANLASLGADVTLVGAIGADEDGSLLSTLCASIARRYLTLNAITGVTSVKNRYVCAGQQMLRVDQEPSRLSERAHGDMLQAVRGQLPMTSVMVLSDYASGVLDDPRLMIERAQAMGVPVYVDPKGVDWERYRGATLIKPNSMELQAVIGASDGHEFIGRSHALLNALGIETMLVTLGSGGMTLIHAKPGSGPGYLHQPACSGPVVDVTGAGDTVLACVAYLRSAEDFNGAAWPDILECAAKAAAAVCARHGTAIATMLDMELT